MLGAAQKTFLCFFWRLQITIWIHLAAVIHVNMSFVLGFSYITAKYSIEIETLLNSLWWQLVIKYMFMSLRQSYLNILSQIKHKLRYWIPGTIQPLEVCHCTLSSHCSSDYTTAPTSPSPAPSPSYNNIYCKLRVKKWGIHLL